jgi:hypothetical protein
MTTKHAFLNGKLNVESDHVLSCWSVCCILCGAAVNCGLARQLHTRGWFNRTSPDQAPTPTCNLDQNNTANWRREMGFVWPGGPYDQKLISGNRTWVAVRNSQIW